MKKTLRYHNGRTLEIDVPEKLSPKKLRELQAKAGEERERLAERNARATGQLQTPEERYKDAAKRFDETHPDLIADPALLSSVALGIDHEMTEAMARGAPIDYDRIMEKVGEQVRQHANLASGEQRERTSILDELRRSRGQSVE